MSELFLELFSEEMPSGLQKNAREGILKLFTESFDKLNINFKTNKSYSTAKRLVFSALRNKKHVITANKSLMSKYGDELASLAEKNRVNLEYEASVAGGIPIIRTIKVCTKIIKKWVIKG